MKKILSLMALLLLTVTTAWAEVKDVTYALQKDDAFVSGTTVNVTKGDATVATITYGEDGGANFKAAKANGSVDGFTAFTEGNGTNGNLTGGTFYTIVPSYDGTIDIAVVINADKTLIVEENGKALEGFEKQTEKLYGIQTFNVTAGKSYKCYVSGSKMGFYGFKYTWEEAPAPADKIVYFDNSKSNWENVYAYAWNGEGEVSEQWHGDKMTLNGETGLYEWTTTGAPTNIIFNNGIDDGPKTADLGFVDGVTYNEDGRVFTVTFKTNCDWTKAYAYTYTGETKQLGPWPGKEMTPANEDGTWTITFGAVNAPETIIFNNNAGEQTSDLTFEDGEAYEYMMNEYTATFTTDANWETVKAYVWTGEGENEYLGKWPGTTLTANEGVYTVTIKTWGDAPEKIIFNDGGSSQTSQDGWTFVNDKAYAYIINPLFAIKSGVTYTYGQTVYVADADKDVVATLTFGNKGENGANFNETTDEPDKIEGYASFSARTNGGNGENGNKSGGTTYTIKPLFNGKVTIAVKLGSGKKFYIKENGTALDGYNGITKSDTYYGTFDFNVTAGKEYKFYCDGSKLDFYGFNFTGYTKSEPNFKVAGSMTDWNKLYVYADSYTFEDLAAGTYQFKVVDGDWYGIDAMTDKAGGLYKDQDGNVCFILNEAGNVTVNYKSGEEFTAEGNFAAPEVKLVGINGWDEANAIVLTTAEDKKSARKTMPLTEWWYDFKVIRAGEWLGKTNEGEGNYKIHSGFNWVDGLVRDYDGLKAISLQPNAVNKDYTFTYDFATGRLTVDFPTAATITAEPTAAEGVTENTDVAIINAGETSDGTFQYAVSTSNSEAPAEGWSEAIPTAQSLSAGTYYVWYKVIGDATHIDSNPAYVPVTVILLSTVTIDDGNVDAANWSATPTEQSVGQNVTLQYTGKKKIKSVKVVKVAPAATDLSTLTADYEAKDGETLTGTLANNVKISIADGATVTLKDVTINGVNNSSYNYAGITCAGDATITLEGTNTVKGFHYKNPGIFVSPGKTLVINGTGELNARSNGSGAGIGGGFDIACGNIVINSGNITATGGNSAAGIGGGSHNGLSGSGSCGDITINGGTITATGGNKAAGIGGGYDPCGNITISGGNITATGGNQGAGIGGGSNRTCGNITISGGTITATGGDYAAGIGGGRFNPDCGTITITSGVTSVTATKGKDAPNSIGSGENGLEEITVTIEAGANVTQN